MIMWVYYSINILNIENVKEREMRKQLINLKEVLRIHEKADIEKEHTTGIRVVT
jgi:hypothetical protein